MFLPSHANASALSSQRIIIPHAYERVTTPSVPAVTVKSGDTLSKIAAKYNLTWQGLYCGNRKTIGSDPDIITPGMVLLITSAHCNTRSASSTQTTSSISTQVSGTPQQIAWGLLANFGGNRPSQYYCLSQIINRESGWRVSAANPSGAYGIPQALPGSKMSVAGPDWESSAYTQLKWMIKFYIPSTYGTPCGAWGFWQAHNWY
jgi:LysM repeat protein